MGFSGSRPRYFLDANGTSGCLGTLLRGRLVGLEAWHAKTVSSNPDSSSWLPLNGPGKYQSIPYDRLRNSGPERKIVKWLRKMVS